MKRPTVMNKIKLLLICLYILLSGCEKAKEHPVPDAPVNISIKVGDADSKILPGGYAGVIVYYASPGVCYAYDACCPYEHNRKAIVEPAGLLGVCNTCGTTFDLTSGGFPSGGPAKTPLKQYSAHEAYGYIHVRN